MPRASFVSGVGVVLLGGAFGDDDDVGSVVFVDLEAFPGSPFREVVVRGGLDVCGVNVPWILPVAALGVLDGRHLG